MNFTLLNVALEHSFSKFSDHISSYAVKLVETAARQMLQQYFFKVERQDYTYTHTFLI